MEQSLAVKKYFSLIKEKSDYIPLIKMIERISYNYQSYDFDPLGGWESLDRLSKTTQHEETLESEHYKKFKTVVEVCKASGINFSVMCSVNVYMVMTSLHKSGIIDNADFGTYKDWSYFALDPSVRKQVDEKEEESCLATRFLSLLSDKLHRQSKQELKNDLIKGDDKYPRNIAAALNFLQYHSLRGHGGLPRNQKGTLETDSETVFVQNNTKDDGEEDAERRPRAVSQTCRDFDNGTCAFKTRHTWKNWPQNKWGPNHGKSCNSEGAFIMCTLGDFEAYAELSQDDTMAIVNDFESHAELPPEDTMLMGDDSFADGYVHAHVSAVGEHSDINHKVMFYPHFLEKCIHRLSRLIMKCMPTNTRKLKRKHHVAYVFMEEGLRARMGTTLSQSKGQINKNWVLIGSQSTIDLFCNSSLLTNIQQVETNLNIFCSAGKKITNMVGDLPGYGTVWFYANGIATILSLHKVVKRFHVTYDSHQDNPFYYLETRWNLAAIRPQ